MNIGIYTTFWVFQIKKNITGGLDFNNHLNNYETQLFSFVCCFCHADIWHLLRKRGLEILQIHPSTHWMNIIFSLMICDLTIYLLVGLVEFICYSLYELSQLFVISIHVHVCLHSCQISPCPRKGLIMTTKTLVLIHWAIRTFNRPIPNWTYQQRIGILHILSSRKHSFKTRTVV